MPNRVGFKDAEGISLCRQRKMNTQHCRKRHEKFCGSWDWWQRELHRWQSISQLSSALCSKTIKERKQWQRRQKWPRTRHINGRMHHFRSTVGGGRLKIESIDTSDQLADIRTKPLPKHLFMRLRKEILTSWWSYTPNKWGSVGLSVNRHRTVVRIYPRSPEVSNVGSLTTGLRIRPKKANVILICNNRYLRPDTHDVID